MIKKLLFFLEKSQKTLSDEITHHYSLDRHYSKCVDRVNGYNMSRFHSLHDIF